MKDWATAFRYQHSYVLDLDFLPADRLALDAVKAAI